jgi:type IV pilus assembly protein PilA
MLRKLLGRVRSDEAGFTFIELLVVIVVIGILAAIALPMFVLQQDKANDSSAKSAVRNAASAAEAFRAENQSFTGMNRTALEDIEPNLDASVTISVTADGKGYTLTASSKSKNTYSITRSAKDGLMTRACTAKDSGGCPKSGQW